MTDEEAKTQRTRIRRKTLHRITQHINSVDYGRPDVAQLWGHYLRDVVAQKLTDILAEEIK